MNSNLSVSNLESYIICQQSTVALPTCHCYFAIYDGRFQASQHNAPGVSDRRVPSFNHLGL